MFLSRLIMLITMVSFLIIMCTNCVFDADKGAQMSANKHKQAQTNTQMNANKHERAQMRARTSTDESTDEHKRMHKQAGTTERVQTNSRTSANKQVVGTSTRYIGMYSTFCSLMPTY